MARLLLRVLEFDAPDVFREVARTFRPLARDPDVPIVSGSQEVVLRDRTWQPLHRERDV